MLFRAETPASGMPAAAPTVPAQQQSAVATLSLATQTVERLEAGGPVIGLLPHCEYVQKTLTLHPGDLLLAYTDGISETMNHAEEEWGEDALIQTVLDGAHRNLCAKELLEQIMRAADAFASGAQQHDDMTMLTLRVL